MKVIARKEVHNHTLDEHDNRNLTHGKLYYVVGINYDDYRVINDIGEPVLYPKILFEVADPYIPESWVKKYYASDEYYIDPPDLSEPGFYEDYFDGKPEARSTFEKFLLNFLDK